MVSTRKMEGKIETLEKLTEQGQRAQAEMAERMTGIEATLANILDSLRGRRTPSPPRDQEEKTAEEEGTGGNKDKEGQAEMNPHRKLELPLFDGEDPLGWILKVERYFSVNGVAEEDKVDAAIVSLEGKALTWFQWADARTPIQSWTEFKTEVVERFHYKQMGDEWEQLLALKQMGTMEEYRERFETLSAPLKDVTEEVLIGAFLNGLDEDIRCDVKLMHPTNLKQLMTYATQVSDRNLVKAKLKEKKGKGGGGWRRHLC